MQAPWVGVCSANLRSGEEAEEEGPLQGRVKNYPFWLGLQTGAGKRERTLLRKWLQKPW